MKKLLPIFLVFTCIVFSIYSMDEGYNPEAFDNLAPHKFFYLQTRDYAHQCYPLLSDVATSIPKIRELKESGEYTLSCDCSADELAIFGMYAENRLYVKNGIDDRGIRNQDAIAQEHQKFLLNLQKEKLASLTIMASYLYDEQFPNDLFDPWQTMVENHRSEGREALDILFKGQEKVGQHILDTCYEAGGHNKVLNTSLLERSGLIDTQASDQQSPTLSTSKQQDKKPQSTSTFFAQFKSFCAPYKKHIFGIFGVGMCVVLWQIMRLQHKISFYQ